MADLGMIVGPFSTPEQARQWAYEMARAGTTGLPLRVREVLRAGIEETPAIKAARAWAQGFPESGPPVQDAFGWLPGERGDVKGQPNLVFTGPVGTGKTVAAAVAMIEAAGRTGQEARYYQVTELLDELRPREDKGPRLELAEVAAVPIVVLDDLGAERITDWAAERLELLIAKRYDNMLPTVVTTNLSRQALAEAIGARAASRLLGGAVVHVIRGRDRRMGAVLEAQVS